MQWGVGGRERIRPCGSYVLPRPLALLSGVHSLLPPAACPATSRSPDGFRLACLYMIAYVGRRLEGLHFLAMSFPALMLLPYKAVGAECWTRHPPQYVLAPAGSLCGSKVPRTLGMAFSSFSHSTATFTLPSYYIQPCTAIHTVACQPQPYSIGGLHSKA